MTHTKTCTKCGAEINPEREAEKIDSSVETDMNDASLEELEAAGEIYDRTFRRWPPTFIV